MITSKKAIPLYKGEWPFVWDKKGKGVGSSNLNRLLEKCEQFITADGEIIVNCINLCSFRYLHLRKPIMDRGSSKLFVEHTCPDSFQVNPLFLSLLPNNFVSG